MQGLAVVVISSYLPEILNLSDRILVCRQGRIVEEMSPDGGDRGEDHVRGACTEGGENGNGKAVDDAEAAAESDRRPRSSPTSAPRGNRTSSTTSGAGWRTSRSCLKRTWGRLKAVMTGETALPPVVQEMIYIAVSTANGCTYCVHSHTAAARAKGMTEAQHGELLAIIGLAAQTNHLVTAMQLPVDPEFDVRS